MKIILVTGGNKGIGKALCRKILENDSEAFVYLCSRDSSRGCEAVASIVDDLGETATKRIECLEMVNLNPFEKACILNQQDLILN